MAMDDEKFQRKLAAIFHADVVGYSKLMRDDEMATVNTIIGPTGRPDQIVFAHDVPKTRSGKIMRRVLKALVRHEPVGDLTTLQNPESVEELKEQVEHPE